MYATHIWVRQVGLELQRPRTLQQPPGLPRHLTPTF